MALEGLSTAEEARHLLRKWLMELSPDLRRRISAAGVETNPGGTGWGVRISLLSLADRSLFPELPAELPQRFIEGPVFRRLIIPSLLLVDDNEIALGKMAKLLGRDLDVVPVNPKLAYSSARSLWHDRPDLRLAVVDLSMALQQGGEETVETGFRLIQELRDERPEACVIVHSAFGKPDLQQRARDYGAVDFLLRDDPPEVKLERIMHYSQSAASAAGLGAR